MIKYLSILLLLFCFSCQDKTSSFEDHVTMEISTYEDEGVTKASAMPVLKAESELTKYNLRFDYLLMNVSAMHQPVNIKERMAIWNLYPDTTELRRRYMEKFIQDTTLVRYFEEAMAPIVYPDVEVTATYTVDELMDVASKFFYCDMVSADTIVQSHVCIGLNGVKEAKWEKDYTQLAAFCYEAIFDDFDKDTSVVRELWGTEKQEACQAHKSNITTLDQYLVDVRLDLFERMRTSEILKAKLLEYYKANETNVAFKIAGWRNS